MPTTPSSTPARYLASLPAARRTELKTLHAAIRKAAPRLKPYMAYADMIGYGPYRYRYASGREGDASIIALSSRAQYISLYVCGNRDGKYLAEVAASRLGKVSVGNVCIRFKKLTDLNLPVALELVREAAVLIDRQGGDFSL